VNGHANVYVERRGNIEQTEKQFVDDGQARVVALDGLGHRGVKR